MAPPVARRLNLDFTVGIGYLGGKYYEYIPMDDCYVWQATKQRHYFGPTKLEVSLSGMSGSVFCAAEQVRREYVTLPFEASAGDDTTIEGEFHTFGHYDADTDVTRAGDDAEAPHKLVLYVWLKDGSKYYYTFDVTDQVDEAPEKRRVHIVIDGLTLPEPITGGDMDVAVDDWIVVNEDITM